MRDTIKWFLFLLVSSVILQACSGHEDNDADNPPAAPVSNIPVINFSVVGDLFHDTTSYTEGFLVHDGELFESTGHVDEVPSTRSLFGTVDLRTGHIHAKVERDAYFVEGIVFLKNRLYQLTYKTQLGFIYDAKTFRQLDSFHYANKEGWGLTTDGRQLIMSDGTDELTFLDPADLKSARKLKVTGDGIPRDSLNELEYIKGFIYANIWYNDHIVKIDPSPGKWWDSWTSARWASRRG